MKYTVSRIGCAAACMALCLALGCSCSVLPPASGKPAAAAPSVPTDKNGNLLYDSSRLDDQIDADDTVVLRQMVAYERKIAQNDRLLVIRIRNLIHELRIALEFLDSLLELSLERSEHPADERFSRDVAFAVLQVHELEVHRR